MPETKYDRDTNRFDSLGLDLNRPVDSVKQGKYPFLQNVRSYQAGRLEPREGLTSFGVVVSGQSPVHSERRLNDPANADYTRVIGTGTHLAIGKTNPFTDLDSGYSGDPLALVPYRPDQSPSSFMYVADRSRMRKTDRAGNLHTIGLPPPQQAPLLQLSAGSTQRTDISVPQYKVIDDFDATTGWGQAGTAGAPTLLSAGPGYRSTSTILYILYDTASAPGWACVALNSSVGLGQGEDLTFNPGGGSAENAIVESIHSNAANTTIARIIYDTGTSGYCSIALTTGFEQVEVEDLIRNTTKTENFRVLSVNQPSGQGTNSQLSIRAYTSATFVAGDTLTKVDSFRVYLANSHAAGETVRTDGVRTAVTTGTGTLTKTAALDLSVLATGLASHSDDYMHISVRIDVPSAVTNLQVGLDVDGTTNDFAHNYYYKVFSPADFAGALGTTQNLLTSPINKFQTGQQQVSIKLTSGQIISGYAIAGKGNDAPSVFTSGGTFLGLFQETISVGGNIQHNVILGARDQLVGYILQATSSGVSQWTELLFRLSDLIRVGTDQTRTLANVATIQVSVTCTANINLDLDSWWIGGGYGPDSGPGSVPYVYRYRARIPSTGVRSNWSPALRGGLTPRRQAISVRAPQYTAPSGTSLTTADFVLDYQRYGGQVTSWHYVGTTSNAAALNTFTDIYPDSTTIEQDSEGQVNWQPWPTIGLPVSGTTGSVAGTTVNDAATNFSTSWAAGTQIFINGIAYTIYNVISTSRLEIVESAGSQTGVSWKIDEPILMAQNLPCLWGDDQVETMFACGDNTNPGRLYFSQPGNPDSTTETNYIDITNQSESLMNGVIYNGRGYVFSSERYFELLPLNPGWRAVEVPGGRGMISRWALTRKNPTPFPCILSKDGVYGCAGGAAFSLSDDDLYPLLPNEGNPGVSINGVLAPVISGNETKIQMEIYDDFLYIDYVGPNLLSISTSCPLPNGTVGTPYTATLTATGGTSPYTWTLLSGSLPPGLSLSSGGVISGTPTTAGTYPFVLKVVDANGQIATKSCQITIVGCPDFTDDFNRSNGGIGANWWVFWPDYDFNVTLQTYLGTFGIGAGFDATQVLGVTLPVQGAGTELNVVPAFMVPRSLGCLVSQTPALTGIGTAQFARITNYHRSAPSGAGANSGPAVFLWTGSGASPASCYMISLDSNTGNIAGVLGWYSTGGTTGTFYNVITAGFPIAVADGDTLEIRVVPSAPSNSLEILINSVSVGTATDSDANRPLFGCPGMVAFPQSANLGGIDQEYKNFVGGLRYW